MLKLSILPQWIHEVCADSISCRQAPVADVKKKKLKNTVLSNHPVSIKDWESLSTLRLFPQEATTARVTYKGQKKIGANCYCARS